MVKEANVLLQSFPKKASTTMGAAAPFQRLGLVAIPVLCILVWCTGWLLSSGPGSMAIAQPRSATATKTVNIHGWSESIDPVIMEDFTRETGIVVVYDSYENTDTLSRKVISGSGGYDLVVVPTVVLQQLVQAGALLPLDISKLPDHKALSPVIMEKLSRHDPGNRHAIPYVWGTVALGIHVAKLRERLGEAFPRSWDLLLDPRIAAKLKDCGIHLLDSADDLLPGVLGSLRLDTASRQSSDIQKAGDALFRIRDSIKAWGTSDVANALATGQICLAVGFSDTLRQARIRAANAARPIQIVPVIPREGALMWVDSFVIPKDAPNAAHALAFLAYLLRPEVAAANANSLGHATANAHALGAINPALLADESLYPDAQTMKRLFTSPGFDERLRPAIVRLWARFKTGK
jgi:putrescine transport system substrate-binding protein